MDSDWGCMEEQSSNEFAKPMLAISGPVLNRKGKSKMQQKRLLCIPQVKSPSPKQQEKPCHVHVQCAECLSTFSHHNHIND